MMPSPMYLSTVPRWLKTLRDGREAADVREENRDEPAARAEEPSVAIAHHLAQHVGREESREPLLLALLAHEVLDDRRAVAEHQAKRDGDGADPHVGPG